MGFIKDIFNFDNIGCKIKSVTKWFCWISILLIWIAAPITFVGLMADDSTFEICWIPLAVAVVYPFIIWLASWPMYAFGEFVENIHSMRKKYYPIAEEQANWESEKKAKREAEEKVKREEEEKAKRANEEKVKRELMYKDKAFACPNCNNTVHYGDTTCKTCRQRLDWSKM